VRQFLTPKWIAGHLVAIVLVAACLGLGWWQIRRAAAGNALSFGYSFEWPVFAGFVIFVWSREVRAARRQRAQPAADQPAPPAEPESGLLASVPVRSRPAAAQDDADPQLRAYNEYLTWLNADPSRRPGDYPGTVG
jgi:DNA-binding transcriptional regulator of glucitol operon